MKRQMKLTPKVTTKTQLKTTLVYAGAGIIITSLIGVILFFYFNVGNPEIAKAATIHNTRASGGWSLSATWNGGSVPNPSGFSPNDRVNINTGHEVVVPEGTKLNFSGNRNELHIYGIFVVKDDFTMSQNSVLTVHSGGVLIFMNDFVSLQNIDFTNSGKVVFLGDVELKNDPTLSNYGTIYTDATLNTTGTGITEPTSEIQNDEPLYAILQFHGYSASTLPVTLLSFVAEETDDYVNIKWSTANEKNNDFFNIERSIDGRSYDVVGTVNGSGNSMEQLNYIFTDHNPLKGRSYYRLKQVDYNGEFEYFDPVAVTRKVSMEELKINFASPNPFSDYINLNFNAETSGNVQLHLINSKGEVVVTESTNGNPGINTYEFTNVQSLQKDVYFLRLIQNGKTSKSYRLIKN